MFFADYLKKVREKQRKRIIVLDLIANLPIDTNQKRLYTESLELLDDTALDIFYERLTALVGSTETQLVQAEWEKSISTVATIRKKESDDRRKEMQGFNILLDNV